MTCLQKGLCRMPFVIGIEKMQVIAKPDARAKRFCLRRSRIVVAPTDMLAGWACGRVV
jgi:hypothetical protein